MKTERKSNILVSVIDGEKLGKIIRHHLSSLPIDATVGLMQAIGLVKTEKGTFIFDSDGCGIAKPVEECPATVDIVRKDIMAAVPCATLPINVDGLAELPLLPEKVSLVSFVKVFGNRLEHNFSNWNDFLTDARPTPEHIGPEITRG